MAQEEIYRLYQRSIERDGDLDGDGFQEYQSKSSQGTQN